MCTWERRSTRQSRIKKKLKLAAAPSRFQNAWNHVSRADCWLVHLNEVARVALSFHCHRKLFGLVHPLTMSSSEGENFDFENISGSESDDYAPVKVGQALIIFDAGLHSNRASPLQNPRQPQKLPAKVLSNRKPLRSLPPSLRPLARRRFLQTTMIMEKAVV